MSSGSLFHSHQGSLTHRQKSQRLAAEPAIMMFNDIPCIAVGLEITHSLNSSIHSFIVFLQHRFRHKVTAILRTNIYTLDYYWNIVFDYWNIDLIKYCHVWCAFSCLFINGEKYDQVKKDRKTKGWVHHNFVTSENVVTWLLITYIFSFFPQNLWCTHQIFFCPK